jgi:hypothetical protein
MLDLSELMEHDLPEVEVLAIDLTPGGALVVTMKSTKEGTTCRIRGFVRRIADKNERLGRRDQDQE